MKDNIIITILCGLFIYVTFCVPYGFNTNIWSNTVKEVYVLSSFFIPMFVSMAKGFLSTYD